MEHLPLEIHERIAYFLSYKDTKALRATSKSMYNTYGLQRMRKHFMHNVISDFYTYNYMVRLVEAGHMMYAAVATQISGPDDIVTTHAIRTQFSGLAVPPMKKDDTITTANGEYRVIAVVPYIRAFIPDGTNLNGTFEGSYHYEGPALEEFTRRIRDIGGFALLLHLDSNIYMYLADVIFTFRSIYPITSFHSVDTGVNDYSYAVDTHHIYYLLPYKIAVTIPECYYGDPYEHIYASDRDPRQMGSPLVSTDVEWY